jgi:hypothetical protein
VSDPGGTLVSLSAVIVAVTEEVPRVLVVRPPAAADVGRPPCETSADALPAGPFDPRVHTTLDRGLRAWVQEQAGIDLRYVEQLYTFGNRYRDPIEILGGPRVLSIAYLALTPERSVAGTGQAQWRDWYGFLAGGAAGGD